VPFTYEYPRPAVTVDTVLCTAGSEDQLLVLLIERGNAPFQGTWALPGGFIDPHEDLRVAARREMMEETTVTVSHLVQLGAYGTPHRDPRGHTVGVAFLAMAEPDTVVGIANDDAADCRWFPAKEPPPLAFDHHDILTDARNRFSIMAENALEFRRQFFGEEAPKSLDRLLRASCLSK
jgi:8-oxo-dGTP diphosphatase